MNAAVILLMMGAGSLVGFWRTGSEAWIALGVFSLLPALPIVLAQAFSRVAGKVYVLSSLVLFLVVAVCLALVLRGCSP